MTKYCVFLQHLSEVALQQNFKFTWEAGTVEINIWLFKENLDLLAHLKSIFDFKVECQFESDNTSSKWTINSHKHCHLPIGLKFKINLKLAWVITNRASARCLLNRAATAAPILQHPKSSMPWWQCLSIRHRNSLFVRGSPLTKRLN